ARIIICAFDQHRISGDATMHRRAAVLLAAALALTASVLAQGPRRDGRWEVKMEMDMAGMPARMPPTTMTQCITPDEAKDPLKSLPEGRGGRGNQNCKVSDYKQVGNKITWSMKC